MPDERLSDATLAALRREVGLLRRAEQRRRFPMGVHVGVPAARRNSTVVPWPVPELYDAGLRLDVLDALCAGYAALPRVMEDSALHVWVTRAGDPQPYDQDMQWWGSARQAVESRGAVMEGFYVVTRYGWLHPGSGASRSWKRLRL